MQALAFVCAAMLSSGVQWSGTTDPPDELRDQAEASPTPASRWRASSMVRLGVGGLVQLHERGAPGFAAELLVGLRVRPPGDTRLRFIPQAGLSIVGTRQGWRPTFVADVGLGRRGRAVTLAYHTGGSYGVEVDAPYLGFRHGFEVRGRIVGVELQHELGWVHARPQLGHELRLMLVLWGPWRER